ncbi:hypothetical protein [Kitasatospora sp. NPDC092286]|uniref:hypothetical protein n=1 Tax=Kitasatospora sp. NPDC092286 TaxID=3364087 RepID=UPI0038131269
MKIRIDLRVSLHADRWSEAAGSDPADAARDACWYLSDAACSIPHLGEDGCPADLYALPGWIEEQDLLGAVDIGTRWNVECPAADWITWRADPAFHADWHTIPPGEARQDLARTVIDGLASMALIADSRAVVTLTRPWHEVYDHREQARPELHRRGHE